MPGTSRFRKHYTPLLLLPYKYREIILHKFLMFLMFLQVFWTEAWQFWSWAIFSRMSVQKHIILEDIVSPGHRADLIAVQDHRENVSLWGRDWAGLLAGHYKTFEFPKLDTNVTQTHCKCGIHLGHSTSSHGTWGLKGTNVNVKLMPPAVLRIIKTFVFDPGVLRLLLASMKL